MSSLKKIGAMHRATLNDVVLALVSVSLKEYLVVNNDSVTESLNTLIPYSLRELPLTVDKHRLQNEFSVLCFNLQLRESFAEAIQIT